MCLCECLSMWVGYIPQFVYVCEYGHDLCVTLYTTVCGDECVSTGVCTIHGLYVSVWMCLQRGVVCAWPSIHLSAYIYLCTWVLCMQGYLNLAAFVCECMNTVST